MLLRLLFAAFSAILMTLSPRGWNPRKQKDADSLSNSIMSPAKPPHSNQYHQPLHAELQWKEQHKATNRILKVSEGKQAEISHKQNVPTRPLFFLFFCLGKYWEFTTVWHSLYHSYYNLSYLHFYHNHNIYSNHSLLRNCEHITHQCHTAL